MRHNRKRILVKEEDGARHLLQKKKERKKRGGLETTPGLEHTPRGLTRAEAHLCGSGTCLEPFVIPLGCTCAHVTAGLPRRPLGGLASDLFICSIPSN